MAAEKNVKNSLCNLGLIYHLGLGVSVDYDKAIVYLKRAADLGDVYAQYKLLYYYVYGLGDGKYTDYELGFYYLEKSAEQGYSVAQRELARNYLTGQYGIEDGYKFVYWMTKSAEQGDSEAQRILGEAYIKLEDESILPLSYPDAIKWLNMAAEQEDILAYIILAEIYATGEGYEDIRKSELKINKAENLLKEAEKEGGKLASVHERLAKFYEKVNLDDSKMKTAFEHYCIAFMKGSRRVSYNVGWMYFINGYTSDCLKVNPVELLSMLIEEEAKSESSDLAFLLGYIYERGYKEKRYNQDNNSYFELEFFRDEKEAEKWYLKAIEKGSISARWKLALYYVNKCQLYNKGFKLLEEAYEYGSIEGTRLLGLCYKKGIGVKKNRSKAKSLLKEAAANDLEAIDELKKFVLKKIEYIYGEE